MKAPDLTGTAPGPVRARRAIVFLFVLSLGLAAANLLWTAHEVNASNRDRCAVLTQLATIRLRPGPGRAYEAAQEAAYRNRAVAIGCPGMRP